MPRPSRFPFPARIRAALLVASALAVLVSWLGASLASAQQSTTTRATRTTRPQGPVTTEPDPDPQPERPPVTRSPQSTRSSRTTAPSRTPTSRRSSGAAGASTTMPTLPGSTAVPELLVAGPNNTQTGSPEVDDGGVSAGAALWWVIAGLVVVGLSIAGLTVAFWRHTRPDQGRGEVDDRMGGDDGSGVPGYPVAAPAPGLADPVGVQPGWGPAGGAPASPWDAAPPMGAGPGVPEPYDQRWHSS